MERCFSSLSTVFQSYRGDSLRFSCLSWVSPALGWGSEVSCPRTLPRKKTRGSSAVRTKDPWIKIGWMYWGLTPLKGHIIAAGDAHAFPGFLTPVLTQLSFQSHRLLFSHASAEVRGEYTLERKFSSPGDRTHSHHVIGPP